MSVLPSDIVVYGSVNMPEADGAINGGPVDFSRRVAFYDIAPAGDLDVMSSSASDTATKITFYGRDATGVIQNQTLSLNGQTWVTGSQSLERLLYAALSGATANGPAANPGGTAAVGDVALAAHSCVLTTGSVTTDATARNAQSGSANHTGTTPALFKLQAGDGPKLSPGPVIWMRNGTGAAANRQAAVSSGIGSFISQPAFVSVPGPANLPSGAAPNSSGAQGVWLRLTLPAGTATYKGWADLRTQGATT